MTLSPWVGSNYESGFKGKKILVVGASHYCNETYDDSEMKIFTMNIIKGIRANANDNGKYAGTFTRFERAMYNREFTLPKEREIFWDSIAFYNFYQGLVSNPSDKMDQQLLVDSLPAFNKVIARLKPEIIIIWGKPVREIILSQLDCCIVEEDSIGKLYSLKYNTLNRAILCPIHHPSMYFSWSKWSPFINRAINIAPL